jgi:two-component system, sensor histidine kinase PdtaS
MIRLHHIASWYGEASQAPRVAPISAIGRVRSSQTRWLLAFAIWLVALATRWLLDDIVNSGPFLTFLPAIALVTLFCGRLPAVAVIAAAAIVCDYFWLPPAGFAMEWPITPVSLALFLAIGVFELVLVDRLYRASSGNAEQQHQLEHSLRLRQTLFEELRHRIANQLTVIAAMLEGSQIRIDRGARAEDVLEQAIGRISSITYLQNAIDDKAGYRRGLVPLLTEMLDHIFYDVDVAVQVRAAPVELPDERITIICLIVIEAAMNSLKHIFRRRRGHLFAVELRQSDDGNLSLTIWDDGPGFDAGSVVSGSDGLGLSIMHGLATELGGTLSLESKGGTTVKVDFAEA